MAMSNWCICVCKDQCHVSAYGWPDLKVED